ncbi:M28 family peptidase [candidate division KSB1 bacterium]|nr:M28 family peptidase [candidate division KSB1 bacterium]
MRQFHLFILFILLPLGCSHSQTPAFDAQRAFGFLEAQCDFGPRIPGSEGSRKCIDFMVQQLQNAGGQVQKQPFAFSNPLTGENVTATNVIASFGSQKKRILLCAHWDTRPYADEDPDPAKRREPVPGANDGASGVAVLLELAEQFKTQPPPIGVDIVLFDAEDSGIAGSDQSWCQGSRYFARNPIVPNFPEYAILLDMIGDKDLRIPIEGFSNHYASNIVQKVWGRAEAMGLAPFVRQSTGYVVDDHLELMKAGMQAVDLIDFDYPYWHTVEDLPDKCSAESLEVTGRLLLSLVYTP